MTSALGWLWNEYLYAPLFNALIWLYNGPADQNFGLAIIMLTVALRLLLLPLSILSERNKHIYAKVEEQIVEIERIYNNDPEQQKDRIRELLREHNVSPWARTASLAVQALVLVLLYQVFMGGIKMNRFDVLYPSVVAPDFVFTNFLGTDLAKHSWFWPAVIAVWLFLEITFEQRKHKDAVTKADQFYRLLFPAVSFAALFILPAAKSIFILTSMVFSAIIGALGKMFVKKE